MSIQFNASFWYMFFFLYLLQIRHEVSFKNVTHKICSDACFNRYRMANGLIMNCCEQCGNYLPSRATANHFLLIDGQQKRFCCQNCIRDYKQVSVKVLKNALIPFSSVFDWHSDQETLQSQTLRFTSLSSVKILLHICFGLTLYKKKKLLQWLFCNNYYY